MATATLIARSVPAFTWSEWAPDEHIDVIADQPGDVLLIRCQWGSMPRLQAVFWNLLTDAEQQRANRYRQEPDRQRFAVGRGGARWLAGMLTKQPPNSIHIETLPSGKPELVNASNWQSNVSHAGEWVLWAVGSQAVGVDVESMATGFAYHDLIDNCFSQAERGALRQAALQDDTARRHLFYTLWTRKEAILKATGLGLTDQLTAFSVLDGSQTVVPATIGATGTWQLCSFPLTDTYLASLACRQLGSIYTFTLTDQ